MRKKYDIELVKKAVEMSVCIREVLEKIGLKPEGGNYKTIKRFFQRYEIDTSHFTGQAWSKGKKTGPRRSIENYLNNEYPISSHSLRLRLITEGFFEEKCYRCNNTEWQGVKIPLELEHINGNHDDNSLANLTILCPNCHALTPTYRGRKLKKENYNKKPKERKLLNNCLFCGDKCVDKYCSQKCVHKSQRKVDRPSKEELLKLLENNSYCAVGRMFGVSDNAIRKWLK